MFTVLIAEKEHIDAIRQENKLFFEPFLENKELAFCYWTPQGQDLNDSVPGLADAVGRRKEWRAVILQPSVPELMKTRNPFDSVGYGALAGLTVPDRQPNSGESWDEWEAHWQQYYGALIREKETLYRSALAHPLQRLATWLCFKPEDYVLNEVQEKQDAHDWALEQISGDGLKPSARLEILERKQYKCELRMKENIRREFIDNRSLNIARPTELLCLALRTSENTFFDPDTFWNVRRDSEYTAFADRNLYFDKMRFLVFDLLPRTHRNYRTDYIRFLATVLILAANTVPGSALQARRLYQLQTEADDTPLCTLITSYDRKLAATSEAIAAEMEKIRGDIPAKLTDKAAEALFCTPKDVAVLLDETCEPSAVLVDKDYGLAFDCPENERQKWSRDRAASEKALAYIVKQQSRAVKSSVAQMHNASEAYDVNISRLTPLQIEDVREYTDAAEDTMISSIPPDLADLTRYSRRLSDAAEQVEKTMDRRMTRKTTLILGGVCLGLYLACFLPFLFSNAGGTRTVLTAVGLIGGMLGLLGVILFITLLVLRSSVVEAVKDYNDTADEVMEDIYASLRRVSGYLSAVCNVRRGHAVQNHAKKNVDEYTRSIRVRKKHQEDIRKRRAFLEENYRDYLGDRSYCDEAMSRPFDYDFDQRKEYEYPAPFLAGDCRQIEFITSGNFVTVPSSYVTGILVRKEEIYES